MATVKFMSKDFYVYIHVKDTDGTPFYIGKGSNRRAYESGKRRSKWWNRTVDKYGYDIIILEDNLTEDEAFKLEKYWIKRIGRIQLGLGTLVNMTDGGEGSSGRINTEESIRKTADAHRGTKRSYESRMKMSEWQIGRKLTKEHKINIGKSLKGRELSDETKCKMSKVQNNRSEEWVNKLNKSRFGREVSDETKFKMSKVQTKYKCIINSVEYESINMAIKELSIPSTTIHRRLKSPKYINYIKIKI